MEEQTLLRKHSSGENFWFLEAGQEASQREQESYTLLTSNNLRVKISNPITFYKELNIHILDSRPQRWEGLKTEAEDCTVWNNVENETVLSVMDKK